MRVIWKFQPGIDDWFFLEIPAEAEILDVQAQNERPTVSVLLDPSAPKTTRSFRLAGTCHPIEESDGKLKHCGTFQMRGGQLVWHVFERLQAS